MKVLREEQKKRLEQGGRGRERDTERETETERETQKETESHFVCV